MAFQFDNGFFSAKFPREILLEWSDFLNVSLNGWQLAKMKKSIPDMSLS